MVNSKRKNYLDAAALRSSSSPLAYRLGVYSAVAPIKEETSSLIKALKETKSWRGRLDIFSKYYSSINDLSEGRGSEELTELYAQFREVATIAFGKNSYLNKHHSDNQELKSIRRLYSLAPVEKNVSSKSKPYAPDHAESLMSRIVVGDVPLQQQIATAFLYDPDKRTREAEKSFSSRASRLFNAGMERINSTIDAYRNDFFGATSSIAHLLTNRTGRTVAASIGLVGGLVGFLSSLSFTPAHTNSLDSQNIQETTLPVTSATHADFIK